MKNEANNNDAPNLENEELQAIGEPKLYQVYMHNDDYTPMEFVVGLLERFFFMDRRQATATMLEIHVHGTALCGIFTRDIAESKISQVTDSARVHEYPLTCSMEAV